MIENLWKRCLDHSPRADGIPKVFFESKLNKRWSNDSKQRSVALKSGVVADLGDEEETS